MHCSQCEYQVERDWSYCPKCSHRLEWAQCSNCGAGIDRMSQSHCPQCGYDLNAV